MQQQQPLNRDKLIVELYLRGAPIKEIAEKAGCHPSTIYLVLRRYGIQPSRKRRRSRKLSPEEEERLVREYLNGKPVVDLLRKYGISPAKLYQVLRKHGVEPREKRPGSRKRRLTSEELEEIKRLYLQGVSVYEIASRLNRPPSTIYYALKRLGLK